jgi:hypothetical protein
VTDIFGEGDKATNFFQAVDTISVEIICAFTRT